MGDEIWFAEVVAERDYSGFVDGSEVIVCLVDSCTGWLCGLDLLRINPNPTTSKRAIIITLFSLSILIALFKIFFCGQNSVFNFPEIFSNYNDCRKKCHYKEK